MAGLDDELATACTGDDESMDGDAASSSTASGSRPSGSMLPLERFLVMDMLLRARRATGAAAAMMAADVLATGALSRLRSPRKKESEMALRSGEVGELLVRW